MSPDIKGKRRVRVHVCINGNELNYLQVYERACFKRWLTVAVTTDHEYAQAWAQAGGYN